MKQLNGLYMAILLMLLSAGICAQNDDIDHAFLLHAGAAGPLELGMKSGAFYSIYDDFTTRFSYLNFERIIEPAIEVYYDKQSEKPSLVVQITKQQDWEVWRIRVHDERFRTAKNIGIGSTLADIKEAYGELQWTSHRENELCAMIPGLRLHFELDADRYSLGRNYDSVPDDSKVLSVVVF